MSVCSRPRHSSSCIVILCNSALPATVDEWHGARVLALGRTKRGKAMGSDDISVELIEAFRTGYIWELVALAQRSASDRAPITWRGGWAFPALRKALLPMAVDSARGLFASTIPGKLYASVLRTAAAPCLKDLVRRSPHGAGRGGGTEFSIFAARLFMLQARAIGRSAALACFDLKKAFYAVLVERATVTLLLSHARQQLLQQLGFDCDAIAAFEALLVAGDSEFAKAGIPNDLAHALADWHRDTWSRVR